MDHEELAQAAKLAAQVTFATGTDVPGSPFYRAAGLSPEETWAAIVERVAAASYQAVIAALEGKTVRPSDLRAWHEFIFGELFPDEAGRFVSGVDRAQYGITLGTPAKPADRVQTGTQGRYVPARLAAICDELDAEVKRAEKAEGRRLREATWAAARFYSKLLSCHPFPDGNGRIAHVALQHALVSLGATAVAFPDHDRHAIALGAGMRRDRRQSYEPLADLLEQRIRTAAGGGIE